MFFPNPQTFVEITIGSIVLNIRWYAVLILTGAFLAYIVSKREFKASKYKDGDFFDSLFIYALWFGVIGARLWFCLFYNASYYLNNPLEIIKVWDGGLAIQGGVVVGAIFALIYCKIYNYSFLKILDIILPNVLIGQGIGRWGNFVNKECHGIEVSEAYFDGILSFLKDGMYINGHYYEPLFFYESVLCLLGWAIIHFGLKRNQNRRGDLAYGYLMWYGIVRFFIEGKRTDSLYWGNFKMAQLTSVAFLVIGLFGYLGLFTKMFKKAKPTIVFDFDGTLLDTQESIIKGYEACFKNFATIDEFTEERRKEVIGPPLIDLFPVYFPNTDFDTACEVYRKAQAEVAKVANKITPNSKEVLEKLHNDRYHIAIVTTRYHQGIVDLLADNNLTEYIDYIVGIDDVKNLKPDPEAVISLVEKNKWNRDVVYIGDSMLDIGCANNYGAYSVAYLSNPKIADELKASANEAISDMNELLDILNKKISFTFNKL